MMVRKLFFYVDQLTNVLKATVRIYTWKAALTLGGIFETLTRGSDDPYLTYLEPTYQSRSLQMPEEV
jgi:hypothetical protein